jgi:hypothetical protein
MVPSQDGETGASWELIKCEGSMRQPPGEN